MNDGLNGLRSGTGPRIALPPPTSTNNSYNQRAWTPYIHALISCGAVAVPIPLSESPATIARLISTCSGVLLPGSPADLDPQKYGERPVPECAAADPLREAVDELLLQDAFNLYKPLLGVCYGHQALNVWKGGSLIQHLPARTTVRHDPGTQVTDAHAVSIVPGSRLASLAGGAEDVVDGRAMVNSSHHQAVANPGDGLMVSAHCVEDGGIEAVEGVNKEHFVIGIQWHPERTFDGSALSRRLFQAFVAAAVRYQPRLVLESLAR